MCNDQPEKHEDHFWNMIQDLDGSVGDGDDDEEGGESSEDGEIEVPPDPIHEQRMTALRAENAELMAIIAQQDQVLAGMAERTREIQEFTARKQEELNQLRAAREQREREEARRRKTLLRKARLRTLRKRTKKPTRASKRIKARTAAATAGETSKSGHDPRILRPKSKRRSRITTSLFKGHEK